MFSRAEFGSTRLTILGQLLEAIKKTNTKTNKKQFMLSQGPVYITKQHLII